MKSRIVQALALLVLSTVVVIRAPGAGAAPAAQTTEAWSGVYFANRNLEGSPAFVRDDAALDFAWGNVSPNPALPFDNFSARWTRWLFIDTPGIWSFVVTADNGVRLYIDDNLVLDTWNDQATTARTVTANLTQAFHLVRVEYYHKGGTAELHLATISSSFPDWRGEYFGNPNLTGAPAFVRDDAQINFNFGSAGPGGGVGGENFGVRWTRALALEAGRYRFTTVADDGVRLWVDNQLLVDQWRDSVPKSWNGDITLAAGVHFVKMEYYNHTGAGMATLTWQVGTSTPAPAAASVPGEVIVDAGGAGFLKGGVPTDWRDYPAGYGNHAFWLQNNTFAQALYNWARWYPPLTRAGLYEVSAFIPGNIATTQNARYWIFHADTYHNRTVNQGLYANQWVSLGTYIFADTGDEYVSIGDVTYEPLRSTVVAVDALKFTPR